MVNENCPSLMPLQEEFKSVHTLPFFCNQLCNFAHIPSVFIIEALLHQLSMQKRAVSLWLKAMALLMNNLCYYEWFNSAEGDQWLAWLCISPIAMCSNLPHWPTEVTFNHKLWNERGTPNCGGVHHGNRYGSVMNII